MPGQVAAIVAVGALTFAVIEAGERGVGDPAAIVAAALAATATVAFLAIERRSPHPAVPFDLFRSPMVTTAIFAGLVFNFAFYGQVFALTLYFQEVLGHSALISGLHVPAAVRADRRARTSSPERSPAATGRGRR